MATKVDELYVEVTTKADRLDAGLKSTVQKVDAAAARMQVSLTKVDGAFAKLGERVAGKFQSQIRGLIPAVTLAGLAAFTKSSIDAVDAINDMSKKTGIAVETLQGLQYVAKLSGSDIETFTGAIGKMNKNIGEAVTGNKAAQQAFAQLGLNFKALQASSPEQSFFMIAERISQLGTEAERTKARMDIFGKSGNELAAAMEDGARGIKTLMAEARSIGIIFSQEQVARLAEFNDRWDAMTSKLRALSVDGFLNLADSADVAIDRVNILLGRLSKVSAFGLAEKKTSLASDIALAQRDIASSQANPILSNLAPGVIDRQKEALRQLQIELLNVDYALHQANANEAQSTAIKEKLAAATKKYTATLSENADVAKVVKEQTTELDREFARVLEGVHDRALAQPAEEAKAREEAMRKSVEAAERYAEQMAQPFEHAFERVQDSLADMLAEGKFSFESLASIAKRLAAEVASAWVIRPILNGVVGGASGGGSSGGGLLGNVGSSAATNLLGGSSLFAGFNSAGANAFPALFGLGAPASAAELGVSAGSGAGLLSGLGMTPATAAIAVAALVLPKIIKAFSGTPHPAATFGGSIGAGGALNVGFDSKHMDTSAAQQLAEQVAAITGALGSAGIGVRGQIDGGIDNGRFGGGFFGVGGGTANIIKFDPNSAESLDHALAALTVQLTKTADITNDRLKKALENLQVEGKGAAEVLNEIVNAATFDQRQASFKAAIEDEIFKLTDAAGYQRKTINDQAEALLKQAKELEVDPALIERWRAVQLGQIQLSDSTKAAYQAVQDAMEQAEQAADRWESLRGKIEATISGLNLGNLSALSPEAKYQLSRKALDDAAYQALGLGNAAAFDTLPDLVNSFLEQSRNLFASSAQYKTDFGYGQSVLENALSESGRYASISREQAQQLRSALGTIPGNDNSPASGDSGAAQVALLRRMADALEQNNAQVLQYAIANKVAVGI